jgi:hypothetical protein
MELKLCNTCRIFKELPEMVKDSKIKSGYSSICKLCLKHKRKLSYLKNKKKINEINKKYKENNQQKTKEWNKKYRENNQQKIKEYIKNYSKLNKDKLTEYQLNYRNNNINNRKEWNRQYYSQNKEILKVKAKEYRDNNREKININVRLRKENDQLYKLRIYISKVILKSIKQNGYKKTSKSFDILGCNHIDLKKHLESKFENWMTWDNHGKWNGELNYGWDIDHIIPLSSAKTEEDIYKLNHYTNLQPLCSQINRYIKKDTL